MSTNNINAVPLEQSRVFNPVFLVYSLICTGLSIFFLLYFNRVFAWLVAHGIRTWSWHRYRIYIDFQALQISLLGGRLFFTSLRYHGNNETFHIQNGHITWSYWLRRVRDVDIGTKPTKVAESVIEKRRNADLPCRINVSLNGLEWFVYNRSPVYDGILRNLSEDKSTTDVGTEGSTREKTTCVDQLGASSASMRHYGKPPNPNSVQEHKEGGDASADSVSSEGTELPFLLHFFPIHVECRTAALVMGNENTKAVLIVKAEAVSGEVDAAESGSADPYRQLFKFNFRHPVVEMRPNADFREDQESRATRGKRPAPDVPPVKKRTFLLRSGRRLTRSLRNLVPFWRKSVESLSPTRSEGALPAYLPGGDSWQGLSRYLHDDMEDKARWASVEYAAVPTIVDSPSATMTLFWDIPAKVTQISNQSDDINGDPPPAWGIHLSIQGGTVNYGPWADRQRAELQRFFFPSVCKDAIPAQRLKLGEYRLATKFTLYVELDKEVTVRVPTREPSKNWRFKGKVPPTQPRQPGQKRKQRNREKKEPDINDPSRIRPAGWLDLRVSANATISYTMDMLAGPGGYSTVVDVDLPETELSSSVNHELMWRSGPQHIACDLSSPLKWNTLRTWRFDITSDNLELFLLRDHVFLLIDLVDDWTTGPPPDYLVFTPFKYDINLNFNHVKVFFNVNDANVINNPTSLEDNTYLILSSNVLHTSVSIPVDIFRPPKNHVPFEIKAESLEAALHLPLSNTQATFIRSKTLGQAESAVVSGEYHYNATTSPANTDTLILNISGQSPIVTAYGFLVRYLLLLKDNYFGEHVHFRTLEEYQESLRQESEPVPLQQNQPPHQVSNDLDVILNVRVDDPRLFLPTNLYDACNNIQVETACLGVDLRFTNYYMDLELSVGPLNLALGPGEQTDGVTTPSPTSTQMFIDGLSVYGHRLFGLPPAEPTYLCIWDLAVGAVTGECTAEFLTSLARGGKAFLFGFDDEENALVPYSSLIFYDVTFLTVSVESVKVWLHVDEAAYLFSTDSIDVDFNDWARTHYSKRANVTVPNVQLACLDSETAARHKSRYRHDIAAEALLRTSVQVSMIGRKFEFSQERKLQQELVRREDERTRRTQFLLLPGLLDEFQPTLMEPPAQGLPPMPGPISNILPQEDGKSAKTSILSRPMPSIERQTSFLSLSSGSQHSVVRTDPSRSRSRGKVSLGLIGPERTAMHLREFSTSSERHSAFYSALADNTHGDASRPSAVTFSSQYYPPHFPLENLRPNAADAAIPSVEPQEADPFDVLELDLEDIDPEILSEDHLYTSFIVEFPSGISGFLNPVSVHYAASLLSALQPSSPEDALDELQMSSMTEIVDLKRLAKVRGNVTDLMIRLPSASIRFINTTEAETQNTTGPAQDQYDAVLRNLVFVTRGTTKWEDPFKFATTESRRSLHLRLGSAEVTASERFPEMNETQPAVMAQIEEAVVSMGSRDVIYLDASIGAVRASTASGKIDYLAGLIHRTNLVVTEMDRLFSDVLATNKDRIRFLVHHLAVLSNQSGDAPFFTRPSAVLRSAESHLRTFDSWKLILRLRQTWCDMSLEEQEALYLSCWGSHPIPPSNAAMEVMSAFQKWRSWDLGNLVESVLLRAVFALPDGKPSLENALPLLGACQIEEIELVLDPGPKENKTTILDLTARLERNSERHDWSEAFQDVEGPLTVLNICCEEVAANINWELCELANNVLRLYSENLANEEPPLNWSSQSEPLVSPPKTPQAFHVVFSLRRGAIAVDTINMSAKLLAHDLTISFLRHDVSTGGRGTNFLLSCHGINSRLHSHAQLLGMFQLQEPSLFISHTMQLIDSIDSHTVKSTASSKSLTLIVKQDPIALLEVLDLLVRDEATQLYRLKNQLPRSSPKPRRRSKKIAERLSAYRVNVALFLDEYRIGIPLLQSLTYNISGVVSRAAVAANFGKELIFDFDISENSHEIQIEVNNEPRSISLLSIPPMNGRLTSHIGDSEHALALFASMELIQLDASAVYSLLKALNRPEISNAIHDIQEQVQSISAHVEDLFESDAVIETTTVLSTQSRIVYTVHITLAGLEIAGTTPLDLNTQPIAHLLACLGKVHLEMSNQVEARGPILEHPELHIHVGQMLLDLRKGREGEMKSCGNVSSSALISATTRHGADGEDERAFSFRSDGFEVNLSPETISTLVDVLGYLGDKIKDLDTSRELEYLRKLRQTKPKIAINDQEEADEADLIDAFLSSIVYQFEVHNARIRWLIADLESFRPGEEDLVLSIKLLEFGTRKTKSARLAIQNFQLQMVPPGFDPTVRSHHSALLPEVVFKVAYFSTSNSRRLAFQAVGKSLDLRLTSGFILPAFNLKKSITLSINNVQQASQNWNTGISSTKPEEPATARNIMGTKRLESILIDADFAGAVVHMSAKRPIETQRPQARHGRASAGGKYGQFSDDTGGSISLRSPGLAWKMEYRDNDKDDPSLCGEVKIEESSNVLYPSVVPLVMDITSSIKDVVSNDEDGRTTTTLPTASSKQGEEDKLLTADADEVLGRLRLNLGLRICKQEFTLSCQPIARVAATTHFEDIYLTVNTVRSNEAGNFLAISSAISNLQASVQHVYSRESTGSFEVESIVLSLMNSKHYSGRSGVSAILKVSPTKIAINAKQLQDFLLFREIWYPAEIRQVSVATVTKLQTETSQGHLVQRYQQVAATAAFPWTATVSVSSLKIGVDLGQAIGKSVFAINDFWVSSKKTSDWEQNLCLGFDRIGADCTGRLSGFVALQDFRLRTFIQWPLREKALNETPLVQASISFSQFRLKAAFDYQAFLVADITSLEFLMYNVRRSMGNGDRLVAIFDGEAIQVFGTTTSAAQVVALYQAIQKLIQERRGNFETSLKEIERFMRRKSSSLVSSSQQSSRLPKLPEDDTLAKSPISLDTDVVVTLKALNLGVFPSTFSDHQVFKMEALDAQARFAANIAQRRVHSILDLTLGQLRIGLAGVRNIEAPKTLNEISVEDVVGRATGSRGGTILKVPRVHAAMETWQSPKDKRIDYIFKSAFEGKVEVGWNYSRISYIRGMWANHTKTLEQTWGKELAVTAIKVTGVPDGPGDEGGGDGSSEQQKQKKITAEVNVPQSKYEYLALEEPIIETPQLRDMGEATPPLEWIGLHRDRLPNLTHQIVIVSLLELAGEVEDAYARILGSS
ncbi:hypothetical protein jhhlp_003607 [Lomentospora prolificans]|uniref:Elongation factor 2 n=1 Tax=Lomentospora prolificans TaxID=41688 RepID=A0A2N3N9A1_9PEZI|nr:hypothetical protein jhhlp_003607 [Lomentospora prolificans]